MAKVDCPICECPANRLDVDAFVREWTCPRCGKFGYHRSKFEPELNPIPEPFSSIVREPSRLCGWIREQNDAGVEFAQLSDEVVLLVSRRAIPTLRERANRALLVIAKKYPEVIQQIGFETFFDDLEIQGRCYCKGEDDVRMLLYVLIGDGYLDERKASDTHRPTSAAINVKGIMAAEALGASASDSAQGFVAMWFDESLDVVWADGFEPAIRNAGYRGVRVDAEEYVGGVSDKLMAEIRKSRFVVVDYTAQRNGVYFEAGFALGLNLFVIPTCREDDVGNLHFDIKHLNTLLWKTPAELAEKLERRIRAVVGTGPYSI